MVKNVVIADELYVAGVKYVQPTEPPKIYKALISQNAPQTTTSAALYLWAFYTITNMPWGSEDDFSNMELISGTMNTEWCVFRAIATYPNFWWDTTEVSYYGEPYIVSTDVNGNYMPFVNTIWNIAFVYNGVGSYLLNLNGAYPMGKTMIKLQLIDGTSANSYSINGLDSIPDTLYVNTTTSNASADGVLNYTPITIEVYP